MRASPAAQQMLCCVTRGFGPRVVDPREYLLRELWRLGEQEEGVCSRFTAAVQAVSRSLVLAHLITAEPKVVFNGLCLLV